MQALILCGGKGTRLYPLTKHIPKPMLPIKDKPVLEHLILYLKGHGIKDVVLAVGYLKEQIIDYFKDGSEFGVNITYSCEDTPLGTGGAIKNAHLTEPFLVMNGDTLLSVDIDEFIKAHKNQITIAVAETQDTSRFGSFFENSNLVSIGFYLINPEILKLISDGFCSLEKDIFPLIELGFYKYEGEWVDMGIPEVYKAIK